MEVYMEGMAEMVAPFAGAGIETDTVAKKLFAGAVAPFAGAGIETSNNLLTDDEANVAPFAGAGIETFWSPCFPPL